VDRNDFGLHDGSPCTGRLKSRDFVAGCGARLTDSIPVAKAFLAPSDGLSTAATVEAIYLEAA